MPINVIEEARPVLQVLSAPGRTLAPGALAFFSIAALGEPPLTIQCVVLSTIGNLRRRGGENLGGRCRYRFSPAGHDKWGCYDFQRCLGTAGLDTNSRRCRHSSRGQRARPIAQLLHDPNLWRGITRGSSGRWLGNRNRAVGHRLPGFDRPCRRDSPRCHSPAVGATHC